MVVFRLKGENELTEKLLKRMNSRGNVHCVPASLKGRYVIRFTITSQRTTIQDVLEDWAEVRRVADEILKERNVQNGYLVGPTRIKVPLGGEETNGCGCECNTK